MFIEYTALWSNMITVEWIFTFIYLCWIYDDAQRHKARMALWIAGVLAVSVPSSLYTLYYWAVILPSRVAMGPCHIIDLSNFVEPIWVLDAFFLWNLASSTISTTISALILFWIYSDCKKSGTRATPWIFAMISVLNLPFPLSMVFPIGGWSGQIIILIGYILQKLGYIRIMR